MEEIDLRLFFVNSVSGFGPIFVKCQEHRDQNRPSLAIYRDGIYCYSCPFQIQNTRKALEYLSQFEIKKQERAYTSKRENSEVVGYVSESLVNVYHRFLLSPERKESLEWLYRRTLSERGISEFKLGHDGKRYSIPIRAVQGGLRNIRFRADPCFSTDQEAKYSGLSGFNDPYIYPAERQSDSRSWRVVTESELCSILLWQNDVPSVTITNGAGQLGKLLEQLDPFSHIDTLYIASDIDSAGMNAYKQLQTSQSRFKVIPVSWKEEYGKDVTEVFQHGRGEEIFFKFRRKPGEKVNILDT